MISRPYLLSILAVALLTVLIAPAAHMSPVFAEQERLSPPELSAQAAISIDADTGEVLFDKNSHLQMSIASTTKIMTAILAVERANMDEVVTITGDDLIGEASMGLQVGERVSVENLLYGMLLNSGNDAAMAIARHIGESIPEPADASPVARFVDLMNARAKQLGLSGTHFANPHGLDASGHYGTAYDLAAMAREFKRHPLLSKIAATEFYEINGHQLSNLNKLLSQYPGADGLKTGQTDSAGLCLVASAQRGDQKVITVVLNSPSWYDDTTTLLDYSFTFLARLPTPTPTAAAETTLELPSPEQAVTSRTGAAADRGTVNTPQARPAPAIADWSTVALALLVAFAFVAGLRLLITMFARRFPGTARSSRGLALAQSAGMSSEVADRVWAGDDWSGGSQAPFSGLDRRGRMTLHSGPDINRDFSSEAEEQQYLESRAATSSPVAALIRGVRDQLLAGDEEAATLGLIRLVRTNVGVYDELAAQLGSLPPASLACAVRAFVVCGEKDHARELLKRAGSLYPGDSRLQVLKRLID